ncbi:MAG TPA: porin, partial [Gallionella sp.]|nr:porin [Gallionella sp.]
DLRTNNSINYTSPSMGGLSVAAASVFGAEGAASGDKKGTLMSLAGMYNMSGIYATLAYQSVKFGTVGDLNAVTWGAAVDDKSTALKLGGGFSMDAFTVNAVVERLKDTQAIGSVETTGTNMYLAGKFALGEADSVRAAYTKRGETDTAGVKNADDASQIAIGFAHDMSKATSVYATYAKTTANGTLADPSVVSFGMKHAF